MNDKEALKICREALEKIINLHTADKLKYEDTERKETFCLAFLALRDTAPDANEGDMSDKQFDEMQRDIHGPDAPRPKGNE